MTGRKVTAEPAALPPPWAQGSGKEPGAIYDGQLTHDGDTDEQDQAD